MIRCFHCEEELEACSCPPNPFSIPQEGDSPRVTALRKIVAQHQAMTVEGFKVDGVSAMLYLQVWGALNRLNRAMQDARSLSGAMSVCWQLASLDKEG
jgi:hypothetical protein